MVHFSKVTTTSVIRSASSNLSEPRAATIAIINRITSTEGSGDQEFNLLVQRLLRLIKKILKANPKRMGMNSICLMLNNTPSPTSLISRIASASFIHAQLILQFISMSRTIRLKTLILELALALNVTVRQKRV